MLIRRLLSWKSEIVSISNRKIILTRAYSSFVKNLKNWFEQFYKHFLWKADLSSLSSARWFYWLKKYQLTNRKRKREGKSTGTLIEIWLSREEIRYVADRIRLTTDKIEKEYSCQAAAMKFLGYMQFV